MAGGTSACSHCRPDTGLGIVGLEAISFDWRTRGGQSWGPKSSLGPLRWNLPW
ncbi:hypothetical protein ACH40D_21030 [Streptomyces olivaceoviridis]|uniref:Uncharacterized protein n=1 Tax=Streptomyces olivaceoviridis TaxID=1921 RepID=A0ABW7VHS6_STROI|nr:hypothetical protein [Streptomyces corchorusii]